MEENPIVAQEIQDIIDGKTKPLPPPITGNGRIIEEMQKVMQTENK